MFFKRKQANAVDGYASLIQVAADLQLHSEDALALYLAADARNRQQFDDALAGFRRTEIWMTTSLEAVRDAIGKIERAQKMAGAGVLLNGTTA